MGKIHRYARAGIKAELRRCDVDPNSEDVMLEATPEWYSKEYRRALYLVNAVPFPSVDASKGIAK